MSRQVRVALRKVKRSFRKVKRFVRKTKCSDIPKIFNNFKESLYETLNHDSFAFLAVLCVSTILSFTSLTGCRFVNVNIGFVPANVRTDQTKLQIGIFSICEPNNGEEVICSYYNDPYHALGVNNVYGRFYKMYEDISVGGDGSSSFLAVPGDYKWTGVRIVGIISASLYLLATALTASTHFDILEFRKEILSNMCFVAAFAECVKCGCMFTVEMCVATVFIDNTKMRNEGSYLAAAESCTFNKLSIISVFVIVTSSLTLCIVNRSMIIPESQESQHKSLDETRHLYELDYISEFDK